MLNDAGRLADDERPALLFGRSDGLTTSSEEGSVITMSFVGDSTTWQHYSSIALLLGLTVTEGDQHASRRSRTSVTKMACDGRVRLSYLRDDTLDMLHMELETQTSDIVVFNTGVHYRNDQALMGSINNTTSTLEKWQKICRLKKGNVVAGVCPSCARPFPAIRIARTTRYQSTTCQQWSIGFKTQTTRPLVATITSGGK